MSASPKTHHLFTKAAYGDLRPRAVLTMSDDAAELMLAQARWGGDGTKQVCPKCGVFDTHYRIRSRRQFTCRSKECRRRFSVTSQTPLAWHKLSLQEIIFFVVQQATAVKGKSSLELSRNLACCSSTTYVLGMKLREAIHAYQSSLTLAGEVEVDGAYVNSYVRPERRKEDRKDTRKKEFANPDKRCVLVLRQRSGAKGGGAIKSVAAIIESENEADIMRLVLKHVTLGSKIVTDQHAAYNALHAHYEVQSVNYDQEFSTEKFDGINQNQAESYNSRLRRMVMGQIHKAGGHFGMYASEVCFREDTRRMSKKEIVRVMLDCLMHAKPSRVFSNYGEYPAAANDPKPAGIGEQVPTEAQLPMAA